MAETHTEDGNAGTELLEKVQTVSGLRRMPRSGRNADHAKRRIIGQSHKTGIIISDHAGTMSEPAEGLNQIVGKGIVVIDEQEHGTLPL